jgi:hypothetical protein
MTNVSLDPCRLPLVEWLPLSHSPLDTPDLNIFLLTAQKRLRTIKNHRDLFIDGLYIVINAGHLIVDIEYLILDTSYFIFDMFYFILDSMRGLQNLCGYHPDLFICQPVESLQRIFNVSLSDQLLQVFF